jgi:hypothetical protein
LAKAPAARWQSAGDLVEALGWLSPSGPPPGRLARRTWLRVAAVVVAAAVAAAAVALARRQAERDALPVVMLMDSTLPERVYDPETRSVGGTNSDDITDALRGLPIVLLKEPTSALWHREDQVLRERPALVMMHLSSFAAPNASHESDLQPGAVDRTRQFIAFAAAQSPLTRFVIYSRGFETEQSRATWISDTVERFPVLRGRVQMLHVAGGDEKATFRDPAVKQRVRDLVVAILALPATS